MSIPEWEDMGIPEGYGPGQLLYNVPSETIIIELRPVGEEFSPNRIYTRHKDSPKYEPIKVFEPMESCESVVTSPGRPLLFYLSVKIAKLEDHWAGNWKGVYCFDMVDRTEAEILSEELLVLPPPYNRGWVSALISASEDGSTLIMNVAMTVESHTSGFHAVDYQLASMEVETKRLHLISHLKGCFF